MAGWRRDNVDLFTYTYHLQSVAEEPEGIERPGMGS